MPPNGKVVDQTLQSPHVFYTAGFFEVVVAVAVSVGRFASQLKSSKQSRSLPRFAPYAGQTRPDMMLARRDVAYAAASLANPVVSAKILFLIGRFHTRLRFIP